MKNLPRILTIVLIIVSLSSCGCSAPPHPTIIPDSTSQNFRTAEVAIDTGAATVAGTLLLPLDETPVPAVIIVPGSSAATRNGSWNMYRSIGEYLAEHGIATLLYNKGGVGGSTENWKAQTFNERAQDVAAMVTYLQSRAEVGPNRIGLIGHSQGAYIAPLVLAKYSNDVKFVVMLAGSGQKIFEIRF